MADTKKPVEEFSAEDAQAAFANAAKALGGDRARSAGFRRVSIPVEEPVRPEPPKEEEPVYVVPKRPVKAEAEAPAEAVTEPASEPAKVQSERKAWYLRRRREEERQEAFAEEDVRRAAPPAVEEAPYEEDPDIRIYESSAGPEEKASEPYEDFSATTVIPSAVTFDYGRYDEERYDEEYSDLDEDEVTDEMIEEEMAFSALEAALNRHAEVYGDPRKNRRNRYHDYGFGMGITFDGPDYGDEDDEDDI